MLHEPVGLANLVERYATLGEFTSKEFSQKASEFVLKWIAV